MDKLDAMTEQVRDFCDARDWRKYHTPKELAIGMATESSELLQLFRFMSDERIAEMFDNAVLRRQVGCHNDHFWSRHWGSRYRQALTLEGSA